MTSDQLILYGGIALIALLFIYYFIQFSHEIGKRNRYLETQIKLLSRIAEWQGVSKEEIQGILQDAGK